MFPFYVTFEKDLNYKSSNDIKVKTDIMSYLSQVLTERNAVITEMTENKLTFKSRIQDQNGSTSLMGGINSGEIDLDVHNSVIKFSYEINLTRSIVIGPIFLFVLLIFNIQTISIDYLYFIIPVLTLTIIGYIISYFRQKMFFRDMIYELDNLIGNKGSC